MQKPERIIELTPATIACTLASSLLSITTLFGAWYSDTLSAVAAMMSHSDGMLLLIMAQLTMTCILLSTYNAAFWLDLHFIGVSRAALIYSIVDLVIYYFVIYPKLAPVATIWVYPLLLMQVCYMTLVYFNLRAALHRLEQIPRKRASDHGRRRFFALQK